jgi:tensin-1
MHLKSFVLKLRNNHKNHYSLFNLGERRYDLTKWCSNIVQVGWPNHHAPTLENLCSICKSIETWLNSSPKNVAVLHSKGDKGRIGVIVAAYLHYSTICEPNDKAFDRFAIKRFYEDKLLPSMNPSQKR